jgi:hypothetical protein
MKNERPPKNITPYVFFFTLCSFFCSFLLISMSKEYEETVVNEEITFITALKPNKYNVTDYDPLDDDVGV